MTGIRVLVLVTKIYQLCPQVAKGINKTNKSHRPNVQDVVESLSSLFQTPKSAIHLIKNYENENDLNPALDVLALRALDLADDSLRNLWGRDFPPVSFQINGQGSGRGVTAQSYFDEVPKPVVVPFLGRKRNLTYNHIRRRKGLKEYISNYTPRMPSVRHVNIVMFGLMGSGKSSFFNTIDSIFKGLVASRPKTASSERRMTKKFRIYSVNKPGMTGTAEEELCAFKLCDTVGMEEDQGPDLTDVPHILDGKLLDQYEFQGDKCVSPKSDKFVVNADATMTMHVVCYFVDATKFKMTSKLLVAKFQKLRDFASARDIRIVILVTDRLCPLVVKDIKLVYESAAVQQVVKKISSLFGIPESLIYVIQNYQQELYMNLALDVLALTTLRKLLVFADDCL